MHQEDITSSQDLHTKRSKQSANIKKEQNDPKEIEKNRRVTKRPPDIDRAKRSLYNPFVCISRK
ncbi:MAG TPA: hypothetical protein DCE42_19155 [Myxococcales bacterium]|nr:hypothetical protein [Myxococcales bacterium]